MKIKIKPTYTKKCPKDPIFEKQIKEYEKEYFGGTLVAIGSKLVMLLLVQKQHQYILQSEKFPTTILISNRSDRNKFLFYVCSTRLMMGKPYLRTLAGVYDSDGNVLEDIKYDGKYENLNNPVIMIDKRISEITIYDELPKVKKDYDYWMEKLISLIIENEVEREAFYDMVAMYALELRTRARPTLILTGERGAGKTLLVDGFIRSIYPHQISEISENYDSYHNCKLALVSEGSFRFSNREKLSQLLKKLSGDNTSTMHRKYSTDVNVNLYNFSVISSNQMIYKITEPCESEYENQFLCIKMTRALTSEPEFQVILDKFPNLMVLFNDGIGHFIKHKLLPRYLINLEKYKNLRYNIIFPMNQAYEEHCNDEKTSFTDNFFDVMDVMLYEEHIPSVGTFLQYKKVLGYMRNDYVTFRKSIEALRKYGFLSNRLRACIAREFKITTRMQLDQIDANNLNGSLKEHFTINDRFIRGISIDLTEYEEQRKEIHNSVKESNKSWLFNAKFTDEKLTNS